VEVATTRCTVVQDDLGKEIVVLLTRVIIGHGTKEHSLTEHVITNYRGIYIF